MRLARRMIMVVCSLALVVVFLSAAADSGEEARGLCPGCAERCSREIGRWKGEHAGNPREGGERGRGAKARALELERRELQLEFRERSGARERELHAWKEKLTRQAHKIEEREKNLKRREAALAKQQAGWGRGGQGPLAKQGPGPGGPGAIARRGPVAGRGGPGGKFANPRASRPAGMKKGVLCLLSLGIGTVLFVVHVLLAVWVANDLRKRGQGSGIWIALALLAGFLGAITYALVRAGDAKSV